jgi:hypothetical protein
VAAGFLQRAERLPLTALIQSIPLHLEVHFRFFMALELWNTLSLQAAVVLGQAEAGTAAAVLVRY